MEAALAQRGLHITHTHPPTWRAPWLSGASSPTDASERTGYPGFYPTHPGQQDEDVINENNVVKGYNSQPAVTAEGFSAHKMIYGKLQDQLGILPALTTLISDVRKTQQANKVDSTPYTFKLPSRVTWNDQRREAWLKDLADPVTPISKLAKNVPHGYKNEKLLDMLTSRQIPMLRAIWFIRVIGASEIASQKSRATFSEASYTAEWTSILCEFLKKQLAEISLPAAPTTARPGFNIKSKPKPTLSDPEVRARWTTRFSYSVSLVSQLFDQGLLVRTQLLEWLLTQARAVHLGQLPFVVHLCRLLLDAFTASFQLSIALNEVLLGRLQECKTSSVPAPIVESVISDCLCGMFRAAPRSFISPKLWLLYRDLLQNVLNKSSSPDSQQVADVTSRMDNLLLATEPNEGSSSQSRHLAQLISLLDEIGFPTEITTVLDRLRAGPGSVTLKLRLLLTWSTTVERRGSYRRHAVAYLWKAMQEKNDLARLDTTHVVSDWIDQLVDTNIVKEEDVVALVSILQSQGLFSYESYLEQMATRGSLPTPASQGGDSDPIPARLHQRLLLSLPVPPTSPSFVTRRRILLNISAAEAKASNARLSELRAAMMAAIPCISHQSTVPSSDLTQERQQVFEKLDALETQAEGDRFVTTWYSAVLASIDPAKVSAEEVSFIALVLRKLDKPDLSLQLSFALLVSCPTASTVTAAAQLLVALREHASSTNQLTAARQALIAVSKRFQTQSLFLSALAHARKAFTPSDLAEYQPIKRLPCSTHDAHPFDLSSLQPDATPETLTQLATVASYKFKAHPTVPLSLWRALCALCEDATSEQADVCYRFLVELDIRLEQDLDDILASVFQPWLEEVNHQPSPASLRLVLAAYLCGACRLSTLIDLVITPSLRASPLHAGSYYLQPILSALKIIFTSSREPLLPTTHMPLERQLVNLLASRHTLCQSSDGMHSLRIFAAAICHAESLQMGEVKNTLADTRRAIATSEAAQLSFQRYPTEWASVCLGVDTSLRPEAQLLVLDSLTTLCQTFNTAADTSSKQGAPHEDLAIWRLDSTRIAMQAYLARFEYSSDHTQTTQELDLFLDQLVFEGDSVIAGDLVRYLTPSGTNQLIKLALRRIISTMGSTDPSEFLTEQNVKSLLLLVDRLKILLSQADLTLSNDVVDRDTLDLVHSRWLTLYTAVHAGLNSGIPKELHLLQSLHTILFLELRLSMPSFEDGTLGQKHQPTANALLNAYTTLSNQAFPPTGILHEIEDVLSWLWQGFRDEAKAALLGSTTSDLLDQLFSDHAIQDPTLIVMINGSPHIRPFVFPTPWNVLEMPSISTWHDNAGPLPLKHMSLRAVECPAVVDHPAPLQRPAEARLTTGDQLRFVSETTSERETVWAHDVRAGNGHLQGALRPPKDRSLGVGAAKASGSTPSPAPQAGKTPKKTSASTNQNNGSASKRKERSTSPEETATQPQQKKPKPIPRPRAKK